MTDVQAVSAAYARVMRLPKIEIGDATQLVRDFGLEITGPDADYLVWAHLADPETGISSSHLIGPAESQEAKVWLGWRRRSLAH